MKNFHPLLLSSLLLLGTLPVTAQSSNKPAPPTTQAQQKKVPSQVETQRDGQQVFAQNCSRCHNAPQGFSPRISGTIARHMRVRAGLSQEDEKALLRFLNP
jgi:mono/diheme cytochrome c family protein